MTEEGNSMTLSPNLQKLWTPADTTVRQRLLAGVNAEKGHGKTTFTLSAPPPIFYYKFETGDEGIIEPIAATGKEIYTYKVYFHRGNQAEVWEEFLSSVEVTCTELFGSGGTVIFDTFTETYELGRMAHFGGRLAQVLPREYGVVYQDMKEITRLVEGAGLNGCFVHKMGKAYDSKELEVKGWDDHKWDMQVILNLKRYAKVDYPDESWTQDRYTGLISECRQKAGLIGTRLEGTTLDFQLLTKMVHG
jgi:hypothetical protein